MRAFGEKAFVFLIFSVVMAATFAAFFLGARSMLTFEPLAEGESAMFAAIGEAGAKTAVMLVGAALLFAVCFAEGIVLSIAADRRAERNGARAGGVSLSFIVAMAFAFSAAFFYAVMTV